jgi:epoxide hydrolase-like predicted phosphatase
VSAARLMQYIAEAGRPRPEMLRAVSRLRERGLRVGALTNNWKADEPAAAPPPLARHFDAFIESRAVGMRKPDPRMYQLICRELGVEPPQAAFLDDIGTNLKSARALGMHTIKVDAPEPALRELGVLVGFELL